MAEVIKQWLLKSLKEHKNHDAISIGKQSWSYEQFLTPVIQHEDDFSLLFDGQNTIGVLADKSFLGYQCITSVFLAGKAYVPLNEDYPFQRNTHIIEQSGIETLIVSPQCEQQARQLYNQSNNINLIILRDDGQDNFTIERVERKKNTKHNNSTCPQTAYVLFTSGSTGKPKGVSISDQQINSYLLAITTTYDFKTSDRFSQFFAFTFDLSIHDMLVCWISGACLCPVNKMGLLMPLQFAKKQRITVWFSVPSLAQSAKDLLKARFTAFRLPDIRHSFFCGEALTTDIADDWLMITNNKPVINLYGPTESTIAFTAHQHSKSSEKSSSIVNIGQPFGENACIILDANGQILSHNETGELCLSGPQVFDGYINQQKSHNEIFHTTTHAGITTNWYKTGDLASRQSDGNLKYHGRNDRQVQLKGFRVELQEVEHHLKLLLPDTNIVAIAHASHDTKETTMITVFVHNNSNIIEAEVISLCNEVMPHYMVPEYVLSLPDFPHNASGKLDHKQLKLIAQKHHNSITGHELIKNG